MGFIRFLIILKKNGFSRKFMLRNLKLFFKVYLKLKKINKEFKLEKDFQNWLKKRSKNCSSYSLKFLFLEDFLNLSNNKAIPSKYYQILRKIYNNY